MTVKELVDALSVLNPNDSVLIWDPQSMNWETVTGFTYGDDAGKVQLYSDDIS